MVTGKKWDANLCRERTAVRLASPHCDAAEPSELQVFFAANLW